MPSAPGAKPSALRASQVRKSISARGSARCATCERHARCDRHPRRTVRQARPVRLARQVRQRRQVQLKCRVRAAVPSAAGALRGLGRPKCVGRAARARCAARVARGVANAAPGAPRLLSAPGEAPAGPKPPRAPRGRRTETRPREGEVAVGGPRAKLRQRGRAIKIWTSPPRNLKQVFSATRRRPRTPNFNVQAKTAGFRISSGAASRAVRAAEH